MNRVGIAMGTQSAATPRLRFSALRNASPILGVLVAFAICLLVFSTPVPAAFADACPAGGDHDYDVTVVTPVTDDTAGLERWVCTKCGDTVMHTVPSTGHVWSDWYTVTEPGCTNEGIEERVCTKYPDSPHYEQRVVAMLSPTGQHDWVESSRTDATCEAEGSITYTCGYCGETRTEALPALGHAWGPWETVKEPTETETGLERRSCANDPSHSEERTLPVLSPAAAQTPMPIADAPTDQTSVGTPASTPADTKGFLGLPKEFFTAGFDGTDAAIIGADIVIVAVAFFLSFPLLVQTLWLRRKREQLRRDFGRCDARGYGA